MVEILPGKIKFLFADFLQKYLIMRNIPAVFMVSVIAVK